MKITTRDGRLRLRSAFKLMFVGWAVFTAGFFLFFLLLMALLVALGAPLETGGEPLTGAEAAISILPLLVMSPIFIVLNSFFSAGMAVLGLLVYRIFRPIQVEGVVERSVFE
ncbi:hypothetical protein [Hyphobacterium sp.]|uniref:hypothetical protein n=1 Tax=Hyphobacterium sp. TaxID=2004662 RepID=UPI003BAD0075